MLNSASQELTIVTQVKRDDSGLFSRLRRILCIDVVDDTDNVFATKTRSNAKPKEQRLLLQPQSLKMAGKPCLVLDLDETLIHSSFKPVPNPDFIINVNVEDRIHKVYVTKRPYVDLFLKAMAVHYELVLFTASKSEYADAVVDTLDRHQVISHRLFREHCTMYNGVFIKNLSLLNRDLRRTVILDNSPLCYRFHVSNGCPISSFFDNPKDRELLDLIPTFEKMVNVADFQKIL